MDNKANVLISMVLKSEGGYSSGTGKMSADSGGETYCGIARKFFPSWSGWKIVDANKPLKYNQKINNATLDKEIKEFYYQKFYVKMKIDRISNYCLSAHVFDMGVNAGISGSIKLLQKAINKVYNVNISVDGIIGEQTLSYANGSNENELLDEFIEQRNQYYNNIVAKRPSQKVFINGWLNRVKSVTSEYCKCSKNILSTSVDTSQNSIWKTILSFIFNLIKKYLKN